MKTFYEDLATWWPLISPVGDYASEGAEIARMLRDRAPGAARVLELGCGGGHLAYHVRGDYDYVLSDLSPAMLALAEGLNPGCRCVVGDMRTLRLAERFDLVIIHDAIDYMVTESDLRAAFLTAHHHLRPGGVALFMPDCFSESFVPGTDISGGDQPDGRGARLFEWAEPPGPDGSVAVHYSFLLRSADGSVQSVYERHVVGLFPQTTWERLLAEVGFSVEAVPEHTDEDRPPRTFLLGKRGSA